MVWTNTATKDFYERYVREHETQFSEETVSELRLHEQLRQTRLDDFAAAKA